MKKLTIEIPGLRDGMYCSDECPLRRVEEDGLCCDEYVDIDYVCSMGWDNSASCGFNIPMKAGCPNFEDIVSAVKVTTAVRCDPECPFGYYSGGNVNFYCRLNWLASPYVGAYQGYKPIPGPKCHAVSVERKEKS